MLEKPFCRFAVPFRRDGSLFPLPCHQSRHGWRELAWIGADEFVRVDHDGLGTFGVIAQRKNRLVFWLVLFIGFVSLVW